MIQDLVRHTRVLDIVGDMIRVRAQNIPLGDLATVENTDGETSLARVVALDHDVVLPMSKCSPRLSMPRAQSCKRLQPKPFKPRTSPPPPRYPRIPWKLLGASGKSRSLSEERA